MSGKKVLFVCPYPENVAPSQRLKFEQYYGHFREAGFTVHTHAFISKAFWKIIYRPGNFFAKALHTAGGYLRRAGLLFRLRQYDVVYIHLWVTPFGAPFFEWLFCRLAKKVVYDIDDLVYLKNVDSKAHPLVTMIKGRKKPIYLMKAADHVITCTPYLDQFVRKFNANTTDISSTIDTDKYRFQKNYDTAPPLRIGWSGSVSTAKYLHLLDDVFIQLAKEHPFKLVVMGDASFSLPGVDVEALPWSEAAEVPTIRSFDIGVYPLPDEEWVLGKSGLKALQYMAAGVPTVATAIGTIFRIIDEGKNGFLVSSEQQWKETLLLLLNDAALRRQIGQNAVVTVEENYSIRINKATYISILNHLIAS